MNVAGVSFSLGTVACRVFHCLHSPCRTAWVREEVIGEFKSSAIIGASVLPVAF